MIKSLILNLSCVLFELLSNLKPFLCQILVYTILVNILVLKFSVRNLEHLKTKWTFELSMITFVTHDFYRVSFSAQPVPYNVIDKYFRAVFFPTAESVNFSQHIYDFFTNNIADTFWFDEETQCSIIGFKFKLGIYKKCLKLMTYA